MSPAWLRCGTPFVSRYIICFSSWRMTLSAHLRNVFSEARHSGTSHLVFKMCKRNSSLFCFLSAVKYGFMIEVKTGKSIEPTAVLGRIFRCTDPQKTVTGVQCWHPKMRNQKRKHFGIEDRPSNMSDQKSIPAFRFGHRKCPTRKKHFSIQRRPPKIRDQKKTVRRSGVATHNAKPEQ